VTAPQVADLARREHIVGGGVEDRGAAAGDGGAGRRALRVAVARGDRGIVAAVPCRDA
jgi:hypothetical protein